jgi:hypothetical protein
MGKQDRRRVYVLWGIFHLVAANAVYALAEQSTGMVRARLLQDGFYLLFFAIAGILMAAILNWRNDKQGYWMNGTLIAFADVGARAHSLVARPCRGRCVRLGADAVRCSCQQRSPPQLGRHGTARGHGLACPRAAHQFEARALLERLFER